MFNLEKEKIKLKNEWISYNLNIDNKILEAFMKVPREDFMPEGFKHLAYKDNAQALFEGQTISQPLTVVLMTQYLDFKKGQKILEIGTGSGYQTAILSHLV